MKSIRQASIRPRITSSLVLAVFLIIGFAGAAIAHPLGNFTINHFARLEVGDERINIRFVVDMAEIPTLQEMQTMNAGADGSPSNAELDAYLARVSTGYADGLRLTVDGKRIPLQIAAQRIATLTGDGGLPTLRVECDLTGIIPAGSTDAAHRLKFEDTNHPTRIGWHEIIVAPTTGISIFNTYAFADGISDELKAYPKDLIIAPLSERIAELQFTQGDAPAGASRLRTRGGILATASSMRNTDASRANTATGAAENGAATKARDRFAELLDVKELTLPAALLGLLIAAFLGAAHSFSPGHGKTVVGAYLVGSRGTWRHAAFLGATVTITHTLGVFALGIVTLFASQYIVPERLIPILSFVSGAIVLLIGLSLFIKRLRSVLGLQSVSHFHTHDGLTREHDDVHLRDNHHDDIDPALMHSHGGGVAHSHLPPGADGVPVTWRSLLGLGISGGLVPCPSALVVLLSAITLNRTGYGLLLVTSFSLGLAATLTAIGLVFVYAGQWMKERAGVERFQTWGRVLPTFSAFVIVCVGAILCYEALTQAGMVTFSAGRLGELFTSSVSSASSLSTASVLFFGFGLGLKHAVEADHLAAVSAIVSERKSLLSSSLIGGLWGIGHTISLFAVGVVVILLHVEISERTAQALEFGVAIMLVALGVNALNKIVRGKFHTHPHEHGDRAHIHPHLHDGTPEPDSNTHHGYRIGKRPLIIGMVHGLAGSAALMLLVLSTISTPLVGLLYIIIFGIGSIGGMILMSTLVGLPLSLTANSSARANLAIRGAAGLFSLGFGLFMVYEIGFVGGLFR